MEPRIARRAVAAALLAGMGADILFDRIGLGINVPIATAAMLALVTWFGPGHRPADRLDWWLPVVALAASAWPALRTDPSVIPLDLGLVGIATASWSIAVSGIPVTRRAASAVALLGVQAGVVAVVALGWLVARASGDGYFARGTGQLGRVAPVARGAAIAIPVVAVFSVLLSSADAVFGKALDDALHLPVDLGDLGSRGLFAAIAAWLIAGPLALAVDAPISFESRRATPEPDPNGHPLESGAADGEAAAPASRVGVIETLVVLGAVDVLFAGFALVQVVFLFGGASTLAAVGMTYSDYARQGYFQLVGVVALAGMLLVGAHAVIGRTRAFLVGALTLLVLTAIILGSAAFRLALYQGAYGWTELRFFVGASIAWLAICIAAAVALLASNRMRWLPHALAASAVAVTLAVSAIGPQAFVMRENLARVMDPSLVAEGGFTGFDADYGLRLGDDTIPDLVAALDRLPAYERALTLERLRLRADRLASELAAERRQGFAAAFGWNLARDRAREALATLPPN